MPRMAGHMSAPPMPISARAEISHQVSWARPPRSEKPAKMIAPTMKIRLRPKMSASRPPTTISTPNVSA